MLRKITLVLLVRVKNFVRLEELAEPTMVLEKASNSMMLLEEWQCSFHKTKMEIETSEREKRWEFSILQIFSPIRHAKRICRDMIDTAMDIANLKLCFSEKFETATHEPAIIQEARAKVTHLVGTFPALTFDIFSSTVFHHWENHLSWFKRESRFLEVKITSQSKKMFAKLTSAKSAAEALISLISKTGGLHTQSLPLPRQNDQMVIKDAFVTNIPMVVDTFIGEIEEQRQRFLALSASPSPPIAQPEMPPISGTICWADGILEQLDATLDVMKSIEKFVEDSAISSDDVNDKYEHGGESVEQGDDLGSGEKGGTEVKGTSKGETRGADVIRGRSKKWIQALNIYNNFRDQLFAYKQRQYQGWCAHVSDILAQNLTRYISKELYLLRQLLFDIISHFLAPSCWSTRF